MIDLCLFNVLYYVDDGNIIEFENEIPNHHLLHTRLGRLWFQVNKCEKIYLQCNIISDNNIKKVSGALR